MGAYHSPSRGMVQGGKGWSCAGLVRRNGGAGAPRRQRRSCCYEDPPVKLLHGQSHDISAEPKHQESNRGSKEGEETMAELSAVPMVASGDGDASCELSDGRFPPRSTAVTS